MKVKSKKLINNTFLFLLGNLGSKFIQFILVPLYTYTLTTEEYGQTEIVLTTINFLIPIFSLSISDAFLRFGLDKKYKQNEVTKVALITIFIGGIASIAFIPIYNINSTISNWIQYFLLILNLRMYRDIFSIRLKVLENNKLYAIDNILYTFVLCISNIIFLVMMKMQINGYFLSYVVANIFSILFIIIMSKFSYKELKGKTNKKVFKEMIVYSLPMIVNGISWWVTNASDRFMIAWLMTDSDVGIYSVSAKIPTLITTFSGIFSQAWIISSVLEFQNEKEKNFYSNTFKNYYGLLFLACSILIPVIKPFMKLYVSHSYFEAWVYTPVLISSAIYSGIASFAVGIYTACKKNISITITTLIGGIANIILNYILIPKIGILGAAIATLISWFIIAVVRIIDMKRFFEFNIDYKLLLFYTILNVLQILIIYHFDNYLGVAMSIIITCIFIFYERKLILDCYKIGINKVKGILK